MGQHMAFMTVLFSPQVPTEPGRERCRGGVHGARLKSGSAGLCVSVFVLCCLCICVGEEEREGQMGSVK